MKKNETYGGKRDVRNKIHRVTNDMHFVGNEKKRHSRKTGDETSCEKRETRNETYLMKNGTSQEMYGILRETWWLTLRKLGSFNRIQSKKHFFSSDGRVASPDTQEHYFTSSR